jgi:hypothetical protein
VLDVISPDFNSDGIVDAGDFSVWRDSLGQTGSGLAADANGDQSIDVLDYNLWRKYFGYTLAGPVQSVSAAPEPSSFLLALLAGSSIGALTYRSRRG